MDDSYRFAFDITPVTTANSSNQFSRTTSAIYVGKAGNMKVGVYGPNKQSNTIIFTSLKAGEIYRIKANYVLSANTTAGNLIGLI